MSEDWKDYLEKWLEGSCSAQEAELLLEQMRLSPEVAGQIKKRMEEEATLFTAHRDPELFAQGVSGIVNHRGEAARFAHSVCRTHTQEVVASANRSHRAKPVLWGLSLAACLLIGLGLFWLMPREAHIEVMASTCKPREMLYGNYRSLKAGDTVGANGVLQLQEDESVAFRFDDGTILQVEGPASLSLNTSGQKKSLSLSRGKLHADVAPQPADSPLMIYGPDTITKVVGTSFSLEVKESETWLEVHEGSVLQRLASDPSVQKLVQTGQRVVLESHQEEFQSERVIFDDDFRTHPPVGNVNKHDWQPCHEGMNDGFVQVTDMFNNETASPGYSLRRFDWKTPFFDMQRQQRVHLWVRAGKAGLFSVYMERGEGFSSRIQLEILPDEAGHWVEKTFGIQDLRVGKNEPFPEGRVPCKSWHLTHFNGEDFRLDVRRMLVVSAEIP